MRGRQKYRLGIIVLISSCSATDLLTAPLKSYILFLSQCKKVLRRNWMNCLQIYWAKRKPQKRFVPLEYWIRSKSARATKLQCWLNEAVPQHYGFMTDILRSFIRAEWTSNWELHLRTLTKMLAYLATAGHNLYVKCARLYLQEMASLPNDHPDVHEKLCPAITVLGKAIGFGAVSPPTW